MAAVTQRQSGAITAEGCCGARVVPVKSDATTLPNVALGRRHTRVDRILRITASAASSLLTGRCDSAFGDLELPLGNCLLPCVLVVSQGNDRRSLYSIPKLEGAVTTTGHDEHDGGVKLESTYVRLVRGLQKKRARY